jgi:hypothetical protein
VRGENGPLFEAVCGVKTALNFARLSRRQFAIAAQELGRRGCCHRAFEQKALREFAAGRERLTNGRALSSRA